VIYFDSSALVKLVKAEPESRPLAVWIDERAAERSVSSTLAKVEVLLAVRRGGDRFVERARSMIDELDLLAISDEVIDSAAVVDSPGLRSLDAIHLATALSIRDALTGMVVYDRRLFDAAARFGLDPIRPGA
jgi:predicted nucleic acid-binding protein